MIVKYIWLPSSSHYQHEVHLQKQYQNIIRDFLIPKNKHVGNALIVILNVYWDTKYTS